MVVPLLSDLISFNFNSRTALNTFLVLKSSTLFPPPPFDKHKITLPHNVIKPEPNYSAQDFSVWLLIHSMIPGDVARSCNQINELFLVKMKSVAGELSPL